MTKYTYKNTTMYEIKFVLPTNELILVRPNRLVTIDFQYDYPGLILQDTQYFYNPSADQEQLNTTYVNYSTFNPVVEQLNENGLSDTYVYNTIVSVSGDLQSQIDSITGGIVTDGNSILSSSVSGSIFRTQQYRNSDVINVKDFGAKGDGVTDDAQAIQTALNTVLSLYGGGTIYFPMGIYLVSKSIYLPSRMNIIGHGTRTTTIKWMNNDDTNYSYGVIYGFDHNVYDYVFSQSIRYMDIDANGKVGVCIALKGVQENCKYEDLIVSGYTDAGIDVLYFSYQNHRSTYQEIHCIHAEGASGSMGMRMSFVCSSTIRRITSGLPTEQSTYGIYLINNCTTNVISNIHAEDSYYGICISGGANNIIDGFTVLNHFNNGYAGLKSTSERFTCNNFRVIGGFSKVLESPKGDILVKDMNLEQDLLYCMSDSGTFHYIDYYEGGDIQVSNKVYRGVEQWAPFDYGNGQSILRAFRDIPISGSRDLIIDLGSGDTGFAGKLSGFAVGYPRFYFDLPFSGYAYADGTIVDVHMGNISTTDYTSASPFPLAFSNPTSLTPPTSGKFKIVVSNLNAPQLLLECKVDISRQSSRAVGIEFI